MKKLVALFALLLLNSNGFIHTMEAAKPALASNALREYEVSLLELERSIPILNAKANELLPKLHEFVEQYNQGGYTGALWAVYNLAADSKTREAAYSFIGLLNIMTSEVLKLKNADGYIKDKAKTALSLLLTNPSIKGLLDYSVQVPYIGTTLQGNLQKFLADIVEYL